MTLPHFKIYYNARVLKRVRCLLKNVQIYNWNRDSPEIDSHATHRYVA